jgi:hypothetical protein
MTEDQSTRAPAAVDREPTNPDMFTRLDIREIEVLAALDDEDFARRVNEWVAQPDRDGSGRRVFLSARLVMRTEEALTVLIHATKQREIVAQGRAKKDLRSHGLKLSEIRREAAQIRDTIRRRIEAQRTRDSARDVAYKILGEVFPKQYRKAVRLLESGTSKREVVALLQEEARG